MQVNYAKLYVEFVGEWVAAGGAPMKVLRLSTMSGGDFTRLLQLGVSDIQSPDEVGDNLANLRLALASAVAAGEVADKPLGGFLARLLADKKQTSGATPVVACAVPVAATMPERQADPAVEAGWQELLGFWIPNRERPEPEDLMRRAYMDAVSEHGVQTVVSTARYYCDRVAAGVAGLPYHLQTLLGRDSVWRTWSKAAAVMPSAEERAAFDLAFKLYPQFPDKTSARAEAQSYYLQFVKPSEAADFLCAVLAYKEQRSEEDAGERIAGPPDDWEPGDPDLRPPTENSRYTTRFQKFVAQVWRHQPSREETSWIATELLMEPLFAQRARFIENWAMATKSEFCEGLHNVGKEQYTAGARTIDACVKAILAVPLFLEPDVDAAALLPGAYAKTEAYARLMHRVD